MTAPLKSFLLASLLLACAPQVFAIEEQSTEGSLIEARPAFLFLDSRLFDAKLSKELDSGKDLIEVEVSGKVPLSAIPQRLDKWITRVGEKGNVELKEGPAKTKNRALFSILPVVFSAIEAMSEDRMLRPASGYNASIIYRKDGAGDTIVDKIVFQKKRP